VDGLHSAGDAPLVHGPRGQVHARCPKCKKLIPWPIPWRAADNDDAA